MRHPIDTAQSGFSILFAAAICIIFSSVAASAQSWPEPPQVNGAFEPQYLDMAATREKSLDCDNNSNQVYCTDKTVARYRQSLLEAWAAAYTRVPDSNDAPLISPNPLSGFHLQLQVCSNEVYNMLMCAGTADQIRENYWVLSDLPDESITGDACAQTMEKACVLQHISSRIVAWNHHNAPMKSEPDQSGPGLDCTRGKQSAAQRLICRDAELSARHREMHEKLAALPSDVDPRQLPHERAEILSDAYWYTTTYDCQTDWNCIRGKIEQRVRDIADIAVEMQALAAENAKREAEIAAARLLEDLSAARTELAGLMDGILNDAIVPTPSSFPQPENTRAFQRSIEIARIEEGLSDRARSEGRVYRGLWFWSQFRDPKSMRTIFRGNRTVPFTAEDGAIYFHNGYPLERGHSDQMGTLTAWVRAYSSSCGHLLPSSPDVLRIETFTTSGPLHMRTTRLTSTDVLQFQSGLLRYYVASREEFQRRQQIAVQGNMLEMTGRIVSGGLGAISDLARSQIGPYLYALDDFTRFFDSVGCESPTARQMSQGIFLAAQGRSLPDFAPDASIPGAEWVSDIPQKAGEIRHHSEICWDYDVAVSHNICACLVDLAAQRLGIDGLNLASTPYLEVHQAFMQAPERDQRLCRDPLGAISAGLLSIAR